jgi:hypothetical protein
MSHPKFAALIIAGITVIAAAASAASQQPLDSTPPAATATTGQSSEADEAAALIAKANAAAAANAKLTETTVASRSGTKIEPTPQARKKASEFGFHAEIYDGKTMFCRDDAYVGTRIKSKLCMDSNQFEDYAVQLKIARDMMKEKGQCTGGICGHVDTPNP